jgi:hypothetical protein
VVLDAPTGAGKTLVFELFLDSLRGQAIYTVPTRALANDKLAEWRARSWDVGICTGDIVERLDARTVVATLETQKAGILRKEGSALLVIDEYQLIGDSLRGASYELAVALAPPGTQLLLMSGSVGNPQDIVAWMKRLGRDAILVQHRERPVPLEEIDLDTIPTRGSAGIQGWWARRIINALAAGLGPILIFAPRRRAAEKMANEIAAVLPDEAGMPLSIDDEKLAGASLTRLLRHGVAYHHSGLSFAQRSRLIEPLAKAGRLRVVVATMGLAAGINFSMRSVAISGTSYRADHLERQVRADELLQMYGRAGRRGLDEIGYALIAPQPPRLLDARPLHLRRADPLDWPTMIALMQSAVEQGEEPFAAAIEVSERLFTPREIPLGIEHARATGPMPCGLGVDFERARFHRRGMTLMLNSRNQWQPRPPAPAQRPLGEIYIREGDRWRPALSLARTLDGIGFGAICRLPVDKGRLYGRELVIGTRRPGGSLSLAPWLRTRLGVPRADPAAITREIIPRLPEWSGGSIHSMEPRGEQLIARIAYDSVRVDAWIDDTDTALLSPPERMDIPTVCENCLEREWCRSVEIAPSPAHWWRRLGLIESHGAPTRRGILFSFFQHGEGLAIAAALESPRYPIDDLVFDLANLRAGPRFAGDDSPYAGKLGITCQQTFDRADIPGYLTLGVPLDYGAGAGDTIRAHLELGIPRSKLLTDELRLGDFERAWIEWRSLLRHITWAPSFPWDRWLALREAAARMLARTEPARPTQ